MRVAERLPFFVSANFSYNILTFGYIRFLIAAQLCSIKISENGFTKQHHPHHRRHKRPRP